MAFASPKLEIIEGLSGAVTVPAGGSVDPNGVEIDVSNQRLIAVSVKVAGTNDSSSGNVTIKLGSYNGADWDTEPFATEDIPISGTTPVVKTFLVDVSVIPKIKVIRIDNSDATYDATVEYVKFLRIQ